VIETAPTCLVPSTSPPAFGNVRCSQCDGVTIRRDADDPEPLCATCLDLEDQVAIGFAARDMGELAQRARFGCQPYEIPSSRIVQEFAREESRLERALCEWDRRVGAWIELVPVASLLGLVFLVALAVSE